jgi:glycosyltransferase involved in cell wall biosynthesis
MVEKEVTGIIVSYRQTQLLVNCVGSIRKFYPTMPLVVVDGSGADSDCRRALQMLAVKDRNLRVAAFEENIGHGRGLKRGMELCNTPYALFIDSDTVMKSPPLEGMLALMDDNVYGCGLINRTDLQGHNHPNGPVAYLHPYFCLINCAVYGRFSPPIHHGAPLIRTMLELRGKAELRPFNVEAHVLHLHRGTRALKPEGFKPANWEAV